MKIACKASRNFKKYIILLVLLIININVCAKQILNIQSWHTKNQTKVLFTETHELPILDIRVIFHAGAAQDGNEFGLATLTSSMIGTGTKSLTANQISDNFDQVGAIFNTSTSTDASLIYLRCLTNQKVLNSALQTFVLVLTEPIFNTKEFNRVKNQTITTIQYNNQKPMSIAFKQFYQELYKDHPYGHQPLGNIKSISALTPNNLQIFYNNYYTAKNCTIVLVGDINKQQAHKISEQISLKLAHGNKSTHKQVAIPQKPNQAITKHIDFPSTQTEVVIGQSGITYNDPDFFSLSVGNYILGQPFVSNLFQQVREKRGLVYHIESNLTPLQVSGPFFIYFSTSNKQTKEALNISLKILKHFVQNGPTKKQLELAKINLSEKFPLSFANNALISNMLTTLGIYNLPLNYFDSYVDKINAVTLKQIKQAFKKHFDLDKMIIITVGQ